MKFDVIPNVPLKIYCRILLTDSSSGNSQVEISLNNGEAEMYNY